MQKKINLNQFDWSEDNFTRNVPCFFLFMKATKINCARRFEYKWKLFLAIGDFIHFLG